MEVELDPEKHSYLEDDAEFIEAVNVGIAAADRGNLLSTRKFGLT